MPAGTFTEHPAPPRPNKLLLWDIDSTLLVGDHAGERALVAALRTVFGVAGSIAGVELAGRTDRLIAGEILRANGIPPTVRAIHDYLEGYLAALPGEMPRGRPRLLPGILPALQAVAARPDLAQGLLTGNLARGARIKLEHFDAWKFFAFGAFADDSPHRNDLGPHALRRAGRHHEHLFDPRTTFVIGDTPHDIACGRAIGAATIAVATGRFNAAELAAHSPSVVFADLSDTAAFLAFIDGHVPPAGDEPQG
jgi:phosphoglycolate phosphatase-like HAD superfamily hydrolase